VSYIFILVDVEFISH